MSSLFRKWRKPTELPAENFQDILDEANVLFKSFFLNYSTSVYIISGFICFIAMAFLIYDSKRRANLRRRRQELQRTHMRMHQPRRPGAAYRDHQIFRNAMQTVRGYLTQDPQRIAGKLNLKRTRSGHVYGHYADQ